MITNAHLCAAHKHIVFMDGLKNKTIADYLTADIRTLKVFEQFNVPLDAGVFNYDLNSMCKENNIDCDELFKALDSMLEDSGQPVHDYENWELDFLMDYILNTHHRYNKISVPIIIDYAKKIEIERKDQNQQYKSLVDACFKLKNLVFSHMDKEEKILFPYIKKIKKSQLRLSNKEDHRGFEKSIFVLKNEHDEMHKLIVLIEDIIRDYSIICHDSANYNSLVYKLKEIKGDMIVHHHIESNILFRKALFIEKQQQYN